MARYINADILSQEIDKLQSELQSNNDAIWKINKPIYKGLCYARGIINDMPTADVVEVKHGHWTRHEFVAKQAGYSVILYRHAECEKNPCRLFEAMNDYCPNCGARMDGKKVE